MPDTPQVSSAIAEMIRTGASGRQLITVRPEGLSFCLGLRDLQGL
jgi:hypothetical protein